MNTLALYFLGMTVEKIFGKARFLFIYLFAGVCGVIASFIFSPILSAGASGAIYGCFGALLYFGMIYPKLFSRTMGMNLIIVLVINLVFSFSATGIDNAGHLGGLAGGFLAAGILHFPKKKKWALQLLFVIFSAAIVGGALFYGFNLTAVHEESAVMTGQEYVNQGKYEQAYKLLKNFEEAAAKPTEKTYLILAFVEYNDNRLPDAKTHLNKALQLDSNLAPAYYLLAWVNLGQNDVKQAKINADKAIKLKPKDQDFINLQDEINRRLSTED
jgi:rhomboid protease GluP